MTTTTEASTTALYWRRWKSVPRELGFHALSFPLALGGFIATLTLFTTGIGLLVTFFLGVFLLIAALYVSRAFGTLELVRLEWAGRDAIERPVWSPGKPGFWGWMRSIFTNGHYWLYLLHTMIISYVISLVTWTIMVVVTSYALAGVSYWIWGRFAYPTSNPHISTWLFGSDVFAVDLAFYTITGILLIGVLPFISHGLVVLHDVIARVTLSSFESDTLREKVTVLQQSRGAAQSAEGHSLRRLERDIHDGPQQRLVRMQMDLAAADRQLDSDPDRARGLIAEASQHARDALDELRALSRGFAPPILLDRGLVAALESLADRSAIPVRVVDELGGVQLPQEIERNAYFVASEAVANANKHAAASAIDIRIWVRRVLDDDASWLDLTITDDGSGGATTIAGHGLAGLEERMRGLGGMLEVLSPAGGPTTVVANLPITTTL
jgi:signal transduction histidine kinase